MFPKVDSEDISHVVSLRRKSSSASRDVPHSVEISQVAKPYNNRELTLNMLIKELIFCIALALTTYGAFHNTPTKISKHPQAVRFFNPDSMVRDWYRGQLGNALAAINCADVSFVMYYAPWDAESQYTRREFEKAAVILSDRVHFSAINCWNPGSECRLQHNKIPSWPILMSYTVTSRGVLYKGPRDAHSMVNFLELIMKPLRRISSAEDLVNLLSVCEALAIGYTPLSDTSKYYNIWYNVALKIREFDTIGEICFGVITSEELALDLGVENVPNARLMLWNETKEYAVGEDSKLSWNESSLMHWVLENFAQPVARIIPMWKKAFSFERYVDGNPLLLFFTPLNPLYEQLPSYALLREVAMEYYNCKNNTNSQWISELIKLQQVQRILYQQKDILKFCADYKEKMPRPKPSQYYKKNIISQNNKYPWNNITQKSHKSGISNFLIKQGLDISKVIESIDDHLHLLSSMDLMDGCGKQILTNEKSFGDSEEQCQLLGEKIHDNKLNADQDDIETTMLPLDDDPLAAENLVQDNIKHFCKLMKFANERVAPVYPAKVSSGNITHIQGLACANNFSLNMIAVDSVENHHFAESLGIDILNTKDMTTIVILDSKHESQYVLTEEYSAKSVREFIYNFTNKKLERTLRSQVEDAIHTHYFKTDNGTVDNNTIEIIDLTTHTFNAIVKTPGIVTLVAVCAGACAASVTRALSEAARLLAACGVHTRVARLDALRHDLPWHYTAHAYPALLVFPADGEGESRALPAGARVSGGALVALALRSLPPPHNLRLRLVLCHSTKGNIEKKICLRDIKEHITTVIGRNLKFWRRTEDRKLKDALFKRLQHLHRVSLEMSVLHVNDLGKKSEKQTRVLNALDALSLHWNIDVAALRSNATATTDASS